MSERTLSEDEVRAEHLAEVDQRVQSAYLISVLLGGTILMIAFIALLGAAGG